MDVRLFFLQERLSCGGGSWGTTRNRVVEIAEVQVLVRMQGRPMSYQRLGLKRFRSPCRGHEDVKTMGQDEDWRGRGEQWDD
jgi:hypothetical protein